MLAGDRTKVGQADEQRHLGLCIEVRHRSGLIILIVTFEHKGVGRRLRN
jgi:hypothetical protein